MSLPVVRRGRRLKTVDPYSPRPASVLVDGLPVSANNQAPYESHSDIFCPICMFGNARASITRAHRLAVYCGRCGTRIFINTERGDVAVRAIHKVLSTNPDFYRAVAQMYGEAFIEVVHSMRLAQKAEKAATGLARSSP